MDEDEDRSYTLTRIDMVAIDETGLCGIRGCGTHRNPSVVLSANEASAIAHALREGYEYVSGTGGDSYSKLTLEELDALLQKVEKILGVSRPKVETTPG